MSEAQATPKPKRTKSKSVYRVQIPVAIVPDTPRSGWIDCADKSGKPIDFTDTAHAMLAVSSGDLPIEPGELFRVVAIKASGMIQRQQVVKNKIVPA